MLELKPGQSSAAKEAKSTGQARKAMARAKELLAAGDREGAEKLMDDQVCLENSTVQYSAVYYTVAMSDEPPNLDHSRTPRQHSNVVHCYVYKGFCYQAVSGHRQGGSRISYSGPSSFSLSFSWDIGATIVYHGEQYWLAAALSDR